MVPHSVQDRCDAKPACCCSLRVYFPGGCSRYWSGSESTLVLRALKVNTVTGLFWGMEKKNIDKHDLNVNKFTAKVESLTIKMDFTF